MIKPSHPASVAPLPGRALQRAAAATAGGAPLPRRVGDREIAMDGGRTRRSRPTNRYSRPAPQRARDIAVWLLARLGRVVLVVWLTATAVFFAVNVVLDPVATMLPLGAPEDTVVAFRHALGLDQPILLRYLDFLWGILRGDLGRSLWLGTDAFSEAIARIPNTLQLALPATVIGTVIGAIVGLAAGRRPAGRLARVVNVLTYVAISMAEFWVAIMAILIFAVWFRWLPAGGNVGFASLILPIAVLTLRPLAHTTQVMSTAVSEEMQKDYVLTARAKGMSEFQTLVRHVARNAALPTLTIAIIDFGAMFGGIAVVVETVFGWPGIGQLASQALQQADAVLIEAIVIVAATVIGSLSLLADLLYLVIDPRVRSALRSRA